MDETSHPAPSMCSHRSELLDLAEFSRQVAVLSRWIDERNQDRDPEAATWARLAKITEEAGEVVPAQIGATGQNPRKGVTHAPADVEESCGAKQLHCSVTGRRARGLLSTAPRGYLMGAGHTRLRRFRWRSCPPP